MSWKNLKREYQVIFHFLERAIDMNVEHKMATAKASSNKGTMFLSSEAAILVYKTLQNQYPDCAVHLPVFQYWAHTDKLELIQKISNKMATEKKIK